MPDRLSCAGTAELSDAVGTFGLILNIISVIAFALFVAACGLVEGEVALAAGIVALVSFAVSLTVFMASSRQAEFVGAGGDGADEEAAGGLC